MNSFACRAFQCCFGAGARLLPWRTPEVYTGDGSLLRVADILRENSLRRPFVIGKPPPVRGRALPRLAGKT